MDENTEIFLRIVFIIVVVLAYRTYKYHKGEIKPFSPSSDRSPKARRKKHNAEFNLRDWQNRRRFRR